MQLDASTLPALARGCAILGAGGGGDTEIGLLASLQAVEDFGPVPLVDLDELPDEALIMPCGGVGAPTVSIEKIESGDEGGRLREMVETLWNRPVVALMSAEIGGSNGVIPFVWAARLGLPVVDADGMGRAFPEIPQVTMEIAGISPNPAVMTDERGNVIVFRATDGDWMERMERAAAVEFGGMSWSSEYQLTVEQAKAGARREPRRVARRPARHGRGRGRARPGRGARRARSTRPGSSSARSSTSNGARRPGSSAARRRSRAWTPTPAGRSGSRSRTRTSSRSKATGRSRWSPTSSRCSTRSPRTRSRPSASGTGSG